MDGRRRPLTHVHARVGTLHDITYLLSVADLKALGPIYMPISYYLLYVCISDGSSSWVDPGLCALGHTHLRSSNQA